MIDFRIRAVTVLLVSTAVLSEAYIQNPDVHILGFIPYQSEYKEASYTPPPLRQRRSIDEAGEILDEFLDVDADLEIDASEVDERTEEPPEQGRKGFFSFPGSSFFGGFPSPPPLKWASRKKGEEGAPSNENSVAESTDATEAEDDSNRRKLETAASNHNDHHHEDDDHDDHDDHDDYDEDHDDEHDDHEGHHSHKKRYDDDDDDHDYDHDDHDHDGTVLQPIYYDKLPDQPSKIRNPKDRVGPHIIPAGVKGVDDELVENLRQSLKFPSRPIGEVEAF